MNEKKTRNDHKGTPKEPDLSERVRSSVGRGLDALFEPSEDEKEARGPEAPLSDILSSFLEEETRAAGDALEEVTESGEERPSAEEPPSTAVAPEGEPPTELEDLYVPTEEEKPREEVGPEPPTEAEAMGEPIVEEEGPSSVPEEGPIDITPPRLYPSGILIETPVEVKELEPPGPHSEPVETPEPGEITPTLSREEILQRISRERFAQLEKEIDELYELVPKVLAGNKGYDREALVILHDARQLLWMAPERLVDAEYKVKFVRAHIERHRLSEEWGRVYGRRLLLYELAWLVLFLGAFIFVQLGQNYINAWISALIGPSSVNYAAILIPFLISLMWGGIGGVVGALYSLWWHVAQKQDFDRRYTMWYLVQPIMGFVLGGIVYLIITTGFLALQGTVPSAESAVGVQLFPALVAVLGGFRQQFVYELLERIIRVLTPRSGENTLTRSEEASG